MRNLLAYSGLLCCLMGAAINPLPLAAQEANSGLDLRATITGQFAASNEFTEKPRSGAPAAAGFRGVAYPTWKINENWNVSGAYQLTTRPYFFSDFSTAGYGANGNILQTSLNYERVSDKGMLLFRVGELSTAFGSFVLRYDDAVNPLVDLPPEYGYYSPVSLLGLAGAQFDAARGKLDLRAQFANSSPTNPRSIFARDQYGNWAGGAGYTIHQGFRVGASGYRGPYLDRHSPYFFPGEAPPNTLPARALGLDAAWDHRHTSLQGEVQKFVFPYKAIPTFREKVGYIEAKQVLNPRWFVAVRCGITGTGIYGENQVLESGAGYRLNRHELIKAEYEAEHYTSGTERHDNSVAIQLVTTLHGALSH